MVEYTINVDLVFASLANETRRNILRRVIEHTQTVSELADACRHMSLAAVAKHIHVLEQAQLVVKKRKGRCQLISANPKAIHAATTILQHYQAAWDARFDALDSLLK